MDLGHLLQECRIESVLDSLGCSSQSSRDLFKKQCSLRITNPAILSARSAAWTTLQSTTNWLKHVDPLLSNEKLIREMDPATASDSQKEDWSQILFSGEFSSLNSVPFVLMYVAISKIVIAPMIAWTMPLMTMILPFLALKFIYGLPISWDAYWATMKPMIFGTSDKPFSISSLLQWGSMLISYGHGMYIPYTNARHCYAIDQKMLAMARAFFHMIPLIAIIHSVARRYALKIHLVAHWVGMDIA